MTSSLTDAYSLMMWPFTQTQNNRDWVNMMQDAQRVMTARMPTLWQAFLAPWQADYREIGLMFSEKSAAFGQSSNAIKAAGRKMDVAGKTQQNAFNKARSGQMVTFFDLWKIYEHNMTAMASLASLPTAVLKPVKAKVSANARRLRAK